MVEGELVVKFLQDGEGSMMVQLSLALSEVSTMGLKSSRPEASTPEQWLACCSFDLTSSPDRRMILPTEGLVQPSFLLV